MASIEKKIKKHQQILINLLRTEAKDFPNQSELEDQVIIDLEGNHFQLLRLGWVGDDRIQQILMHFDIKPDGKIWIQENITELAVDDELLKKGVAASDIVLSMHPPAYRQFTAFSES